MNKQQYWGDRKECCVKVGESQQTHKHNNAHAVTNKWRKKILWVKQQEWYGEGVRVMDWCSLNLFKELNIHWQICLRTHKFQTVLFSASTRLLMILSSNSIHMLQLFNKMFKQNTGNCEESLLNLIVPCHPNMSLLSNRWPVWFLIITIHICAADLFYDIMWLTVGRKYKWRQIVTKLNC